MLWSLSMLAFSSSVTPFVLSLVALLSGRDAEELVERFRVGDELLGKAWVGLGKLLNHRLKEAGVLLDHLEKRKGGMEG
jgi:hypothetical protein